MNESESPANTNRMMEEICEWENLKEAMWQVKANKGSAGIDGMTVDELPDYLQRNWPVIREQLLSGTYKPQPVKRVEIPKPERRSAQAWHSDGAGSLRPASGDAGSAEAVGPDVLRQQLWFPAGTVDSSGRGAGAAVYRAGYGWVVDLDLEKFFDRVNHDKLMGQIAKRVGDKRLLKLIRAFLNAGVMENGLVSPSVEGTPQGGPLSPLLSNLVLDELDRELERRGHRFVRYADDCNIYVRSERAGQRVMDSIKRFITQRLKLKVNETKSAVARPQERKFLGFSFRDGRVIRRGLRRKAVERFKQRIREITRQAKGVSLETTMAIWLHICGVGVATSDSAKRRTC